MTKDDLYNIARQGKPFEVIVTPKAARNYIRYDDDNIRVYVTTAPENGKATAAVIKLLAKAVGVPKSKLKLLRGAKSKRKLFLIDD
ncbi:MAG: DUF167 domain-containing protein [Amylibacter sp.]